MSKLLHARRRGPWASALLLLAALLLGSRPGQAQVDTYTFAPSTGTFAPLVGGTAVPNIQADDALSAVLPLGFTFVFDGSPFTTCKVSSNGWLTFNAAATANSLTNELAIGAAAERPRVAPFWDDLNGTGGAASYATTGTAPNRVFTFEWLNWYRFGNTGGPSFSMQVQLTEGTNVVRFVYRLETAPITGASASIGLSGAGTGSGSFLSLNDASAAPAVSSTTETTSIAALPATGQVYAFTPPVPSLCPTPRNLTATAITTTSATLGYSVTNATPGPFTIRYGPTGFNPALPSSGTNVYSTITAPGTTANVTGLTANTAYQFYVTQNCGGANGNSPLSNAGAFSTNPNPAANDECTGALNVPIQFGSCVGQTSADNTAATTSTGVPAPSCSSNVQQDIWFKVTVPVSGSVTVKTVAPTSGSNITDTVINMYSGTCGALTEVGCNDDTNGLYSQIALTGRTAGEVLYIRAWAFSASATGLIAVCATSPSNCAPPTGPSASNVTNTTAQLNWVAPGGGAPGNTYELEYGLQGFPQGTGTVVTGLTATTYQLTNLQANTAYCYYVRQNCGAANGSSAYAGPTCFTTPLTAPANDEPCGAVTLNATGATTGSNVGATTSVQNGIQTPACAPAALPRDVWFAFTATATAQALSFTGSPAGMVRLFTSPDCALGPFGQVGCRNSTGSNTSVGQVSFPGLVVGTRYYMAVSGYGSSDATGSFTITRVITATRAQAETNALTVYPNPSNTGQLTLRLAGPAGPGRATLLNALGQVVLARALAGVAEQTLPTRGLAAGLYTLRVALAGQVLTRKVILE